MDLSTYFHLLLMSHLTCCHLLTKFLKTHKIFTQSRATDQNQRDLPELYFYPSLYFFIFVMQQYNYEKNYPCGIIMIAMNTKNWNRNVEIFILVIHPRKPEQKEEKKLKLSASLCTILNILLKLTSSQIDVAQTRMK